MEATMQRTPARRWAGGNAADIEDQAVDLEVERDEHAPAGVVIHTMIDGTGSHASYYLDREAALLLAVNILRVVAVDG